MIPTQWIETDENEHLKRPGQKHDAVTKSRLVACGHLENREGLRTDSPTASTEALNLICSFAACKRLRIKTADIKNAYFNADPIDRLLLLKPPRGGIPGYWSEEKIAIAANRPIYGTGDAGRGFYKKFRKCAKDVQLEENRQMLSLYTYHVEGRIVVMMGAHVDDVIWAADPKYESMVTEFLSNFVIKHQKEGKFRFCGREYEQLDDYSIRITCQDNTEKILPINFDKGLRKLEDKATAGEIAQMRSVVGSLAWIARQVRPRLCYTCSRLQSVVNSAQVKHLEKCNQVLADAIATSTQGLFFKSGVFDFEGSLLMTISDASWAGEKLVINDRVFPRRSQYGFFTCLGDPNLWTSDEGYIHVIGWKSAIIKRQCRSMFRAETMAMTYGTEAATHLRAAIARMRGLFDKTGDWESNCSKVMRHMWYTDCQSLHDYLVNPVAAGTEDKRLEIDLDALRENLWFTADDELKDNLDPDTDRNRPRWIDTSTMIADPFTKEGNEAFYERLDTTMDTGWLSLIPTPESELKKLKQQKARREKALGKANEDPEGDPIQDIDEDA